MHPPLASSSSSSCCCVLCVDKQSRAQRSYIIIRLCCLHACTKKPAIFSSSPFYFALLTCLAMLHACMKCAPFTHSCTAAWYSDLYCTVQLEELDLGDSRCLGSDVNRCPCVNRRPPRLWYCVDSYLYNPLIVIIQQLSGVSEKNKTSPESIDEWSRCLG